MKQIAVLLAEGHSFVRGSFRSLLEQERDLKVVGEAKTGRQAVQLTRKLRPEVVVMGISMSLPNGLEAARQIRKKFPKAKLLILSAHDDEAYFGQATALGAAGCLFKQTAGHSLSKAIREVQNGRRTPRKRRSQLT